MQRDKAKAGWPEYQAMYHLNYCDLDNVCEEPRFKDFIGIFLNSVADANYAELPPP